MFKMLRKNGHLILLWLEMKRKKNPTVQNEPQVPKTYVKEGKKPKIVTLGVSTSVTRTYRKHRF